MVASMELRALTGTAPGTPADVDGVTTRFNVADSIITGGTGDALVVPPSGTKYSFWKHYRMECVVTPDTLADNLRMYTDGANSSGTGVTWNGQLANVGADAGYRQATGTAGDTGDELNTTNHTGLTGAPVDIFGWTSGAPLSLTGSVSNPSTGLWGDFVVMQIAVASTASQGELPAETFTWVWDES